MIDASGFAAHHNAFWSDRTPTSEHFVRRLNLEHAERWAPPLRKPDSQIRAAFVAELAFVRFCYATQGVPKDMRQAKALTETRQRLIPLMHDPRSLDGPLSDDENLQVNAIEVRLGGFFGSRNLKLHTKPVFRGCGFVDSSEGDVISGTTLFEVKAVDRPFRSVDVRQLLTYCVLNYAAGQFDISAVGVFNPRRGLLFEMDIDRVCREMAGTSKLELFDSIVHVLSSGEISR